MDFISEDSFKEVNNNEDIKNQIKPYVITLGSNTEHHQSHDSWLRGVRVCADIKYPRCVSPEMQRYHFFEIISSQSTMHTLLKVISKPEEELKEYFDAYVLRDIVQNLKDLVEVYNSMVECNKSEVDPELKEKRSKEIEKTFRIIKSNLPEGYELWMTVETNYLQLKTMLVQRTNHRMSWAWEPFCEWIHSLPLFDYLTQKGE